MSESNIEAARSYVARGWAVLPIHGVVNGVCTCPAKAACDRGAGKHPLTRNGIKNASSDISVIERWWHQWPWANVGIATGKPSGIWVVDIDPRHDGERSWNDYYGETPWDPPPSTREVSTGGGGTHLYYRYPDQGHMPRSRNGVMPGVDIKSDGGYVLAPPSVHTSGGVYAWRNEATRIVFASEDLLRVAYEGSVGPGWSAGGGGGEGLPPVSDLLRTGIPQGMRDDTVFRVLRREAESCDGNKRVLLEIGIQLAQVCDPPLSLQEVQAKVDQANKYYVQAKTTDGERWAAGLGMAGVAAATTWPGQGDYSDEGLAQRLTWWLEAEDEDGPRARYTEGLGWHVWNDDRSVWLADPGERRVSAKVMEVQALLRNEAEHVDDDNRAAAVRALSRVKNAHGIAAVVKVASFLEAFAAGSDDWDKDGWLLNCRDGIVDLRTGTLWPASRRALCTKQSPVVYGSGSGSGGSEGCGEWLKFLGWVVPDEEERGWLQRAVGYSLTGDTSAKAFFLLTGSGNNGKSTFLETVARLTGDYAGVAMKALFIKRFNDAHPEAIARLQGRRFVHSSEEVGPDDKLNTEMLKTLTGGDRVIARFMNKGSFEFDWSAKLWLATNHVPAVSEWGEALAGRMRLLRFEEVPVGERRGLAEVKEMFRREEAGILRWAVEGAKSVWEMGVGRGLAPAGGMAEDAAETFSGQDLVRTWLSERWEVDRTCNGEVVNDLWLDFMMWMAQRGEDLGVARISTCTMLGVRLTGTLPKDVKFRANRGGHRSMGYLLRRKE